MPIKSLYRGAATPFAGLIKELGAWAGVDEDILLFHLANSKDEGFNVLSMKAVKVLKDLAEERDRNKDKAKKLEVDKKPKELEAFRRKLAELETKRAKEVKDKVETLKAQGVDVGGSGESVFDKALREGLLAE